MKKESFNIACDTKTEIFEIRISDDKISKNSKT